MLGSVINLSAISTWKFAQFYTDRGIRSASINI